MVTETTKIILDRERQQQENRMRWLHKAFREKYAPNGARERDLFEADLAMLLREVAIDTLKPFQDAAAVQISMRPMPPIVTGKTEHTD